MALIDVFASGVQAVAIIKNGVKNYNVTAQQAKFFSINVRREDENAPQINTVNFIKLADGSIHTERVRPFCLAGDRPLTAADAAAPPPWQLTVDGSLMVPNLIELTPGQNGYKIEVNTADGAEVIEVQINVGTENWVLPTVPPADDDAPPPPWPLTIPLTAWVSRHESQCGIPLAKVDEFCDAVRALYEQFEHVPPGNDEPAGS